MQYTKQVMFPILFSIGSLHLYTIGFFLAAAFFAMAFVFWRRAREEHFVEEELFDAYLLSLVWGVLAARVGFVVFHFEVFGFQVLKWLDVFTYPGVVPLAGLMVSALLLHRHAKKQRWNAFQVLDFAAVSVALGFVITWVGLFFDGTGFGYATNLPWGMKFPTVFDARHPAQLYAAGLYFALWAYLTWAEPRYRTFLWYRYKKDSAQPGYLFTVFLLAYGAFGLLLAFITPPQLMVGSIAVDIPVRLALIGAGVVMLLNRTGRSLLPGR